MINCQIRLTVFSFFTFRYIRVQAATRIRKPIRRAQAKVMWFTDTKMAEQRIIATAEKIACFWLVSPFGFSKYRKTIPRKSGWLTRTTHSWNMKTTHIGRNSGRKVLKTAQAKLGFAFFNSFCQFLQIRSIGLSMLCQFALSNIYLSSLSPTIFATSFLGHLNRSLNWRSRLCPVM